MDTYALARENMIKGQVLPNRVGTESIIAAMMDIPRHLFIPEHYQDIAYSDADIPLNEHRFIISPFIFAQMVQAARISKEDLVLDIACGTGYSSAIIAKLAKKVVALESEAELASKANLLLKKLNINNVILLAEKVSQGCQESSPYDVIIINSAVEKAPYLLMDQLAEGGRLVVVINKTPYTGSLVVFTRSHGQIVQSDVMDVALPVIPEFQGTHHA